MYFAEDFLGSGLIFFLVHILWKYAAVDGPKGAAIGKPHFNHFTCIKTHLKLFLANFAVYICDWKMDICSLCVCVQETGFLENTEKLFFGVSALC